MKNQILTLLVFTLCVSPATQAQVCQRENTPQSIAASNFELNFNNGGAEIQDKLSGLVWKRCVYGQTWNGANCEGLPIKVSWQEALQFAIAQGWRIPDIKELSSILDLQCVSPPLHPDIFPNFPASEENGLWSSTPYITADDAPTNAWWVDMAFGKMDYREVSSKNFVLFVKNP